MEEGIFKQEDLRLCDWQYTIRHDNVDCFERGEKVFLKSNPEHLMTVHSVSQLPTDPSGSSGLEGDLI